MWSRIGTPAVEDVLHPRLGLGELAADPPVEEEAPDGTGHAVDRPDGDQVAVRGTQVVAFGLEPRQRAGLRASLQEWLDLGGESQVVLGVRAADGGGIRLEREPRGGDLAHRHEHREERDALVVVLAHEAAVDELEEVLEQVRRPRRARRDRLDGIEAEVPDEHAEADEQCPRIGAEQVDAPLDGRLDGALALGDVARAVTSSGSIRSSRPSIAVGVSARMRAAASSIASGTPSSARQMRATPSMFSSVRSKRGSAARARPRNSRTAGASEIAATEARTGRAGW